ncbi:MAG: hypothetical protein HYY52_03135 [Candidatus Melainabacteria bacterium]|nr:hypothetical protein [Candidatus Melainabacteria bacterium]
MVITTRNVDISLQVGRTFKQNFELYIELVKRDFKARGNHPYLDFCLLVFTPYIGASVLIFIANNFAVNFPGLNYKYFTTLAMLIFWQFFSAGLSTTANSIVYVYNKNLLLRAKFPIILLLLASISVPAFSTLANLVVFTLIFMSTEIVFLKLSCFIFLFILFAIFVFSLGIFFSVMLCFASEVKFLISLITRLGFFLHPILYDISVVPEKIRLFLEYIPSIWIISSVRNISFGVLNFLNYQFVYVLLICLIFLLASVFILKKLENVLVKYI